MNKDQLKELVKSHFSLIEKPQNFSEAKLEDGTKVTNDTDGDFAEGQKLMVITEDGEKVAAPAGEHVTESGIQLVVDAEGKLTGVKYPDVEGEGSADLSEEEMAEEAFEEIEVEMEPEVMAAPNMEEIISVVGEVVSEMVSGIKDEVEMMKAEMGKMKDKMSSFASEPAEEKTLPLKKFSKIEVAPHNKKRYDAALLKLKK